MASIDTRNDETRKTKLSLELSHALQWASGIYIYRYKLSVFWSVRSRAVLRATMWTRIARYLYIYILCTPGILHHKKPFVRAYYEALLVANGCTPRTASSRVLQRLQEYADYQVTRTENIVAWKIIEGSHFFPSFQIIQQSAFIIFID